jgi:putative oxidoreductase
MNIFDTSFTESSRRGLAVVRIILGLLLIYHGQEVFRPEIMSTYLEWDIFKVPVGKFMVYMGKSAELITGILLTAGFLTRPAAVLVIGNFLYITFFVGQGRFWYQDQHPFMFALFGLLFLFTGAGAWSVDGMISKRNGEPGAVS